MGGMWIVRLMLFAAGGAGAGEPSPHPQLAVAMAHVQAGRTADARAVFQALVRENSKVAAAWYGLGVVESRDGYFGGAVKALDTVLVLNPRHLDARILRAAALDSLGRDTEAEAELEKLLLLPAANKLPALHFGYGQLLLQRGDNRSALGSFETAARLAPSAPDPHLWKAIALLRLGKRDGALESAEAAERLAPQSPPVHALLLKIYRLSGLEDQAARQAAWLRDHADKVQ